MIVSARRVQGVLLMAVVLLAVGVVAIAQPSLGASDGVSTPMPITLELDDQTCGPLLLLAPADEVFALRIQNDSSVERVLAIPPDGDQVAVAARDSATIQLQLEAGEYRLSCDAPRGDHSVVLKAVNDLGLPSSPTASPVATS